MKIHGLQKMTLLDFPGKVACTVFLGGCDFRCPFCHNSDLLDMRAEAVTNSAGLLSFLESRKGLLDGVCFTGGEPLLRGRELKELFREVRKMGYLVKLDTNGTHPLLLKELLSEGLVDYTAMDIKNSLPRYADTAGRGKAGDVFADTLAEVQSSIRILMESGVPYEFRTTVVKELHDEESFLGIREMIRGAKRYYLQRFESRDSVLCSGFHAPSEEELLRYRELCLPYVELCELRGVN